MKKRIPRITLTPKGPSLERLRHDLSVCREAYERSKTYHNAVALQIAEREFEAYFRELRSKYRLAYAGVPFKESSTPFSHYKVRDNVVYLIPKKEMEDAA